MIKNNIARKNSPILNNPEILSFVIEDLQNTIQPNNTLYHTVTCICDMCLQKHNQFNQKKDGNLFKTNTVQSSSWLKKILDGLCLSGAKTLKLYLPDLLVTQDDNLQVYQTSRKDSRIIKLTNSISLKAMYVTTVRMRKQYKNLLQQNFHEKMKDNIDPQLMHIKYFDKYVPSYFHDGITNDSLHQNKNQFKKYVLHKSKKYQIQRLQQHKMNDKQPFCIVKYKDGNCQLFNQIQFNLYSLSLITKLQQQLVYVQSYIKYKQQTEAIYYSDYTYKSQKFDSQLDKKAQQQVIILIGGKNNNQANQKKDLQTIQELQYQMMTNTPKEYVKFMTYKIVHYLNMTSRLYIEHIKIKWIMNDIGNIYLQEVMEFQAGDIPRRFIKYRLPPKDQAVQIYHYSDNFTQQYQNLKRKKLINTQKIKNNLSDKSYEQVIKIMFPDQELLQLNTTEKYIPFVRTDRSQYKKYKKLKIKQETIINQDIQNNQLPNKNYFTQVVKKQSFQKYMKDTKNVKIKNSKRSKSIDLDKWKNIHLYNKKQLIKNKTNRYFTINQYSLGNKLVRNTEQKCFLKSKLRSNNQELTNTIPYQQKTIQTHYRTTISFNDNQNKSLNKSQNRYNTPNTTLKYHKTAKSLSLV